MGVHDRPVRGRVQRLQEHEVLRAALEPGVSQEVAGAREHELSYHWHLRQVMAHRGLFATTRLAPLLAERGIELSPAQVHRLVTGTPERLNLQVLSALCDALGCSPNDLVEPVVLAETKPVRRAAGVKGAVGGASAGTSAARPTRARIVPDK